MKKAIILLSGGLDSAVVLALALSHNLECHAITFDYGQKNQMELHAAQSLAKHYQVSQQLIKINATPFAASALVGTATPQKRTLCQIQASGIPNTYVPARNSIFLSYAMGMAELLEAEEIHIGANHMDHTGYPDCRPAYIQAFQSLLKVSTKRALEGYPITICTPLLSLNKTEIIRLGKNLNVPLNLTISCYQPLETGQPCQQCDACIILKEGFRLL